MNLGLIGAGNFARTMLLPHIKGNDVNLIGLATATGISAKDTARKFEFDICTTDYTELLKNDAINTVMIATRHNLHGKLVIEALKAGKHVYTEKPLCLTEEELDQIVDLYTGEIDQDNSEKNGQVINHSTNQPFNQLTTQPILMVGFNRRYAPLIQKLKSFFKGRKEPMIMHYRVNAGFKEKTDWYQDKDIGGGRIIGEVCHFIDTFQYVTDSIPVSVFAQTIKTDNQATTLEDNVIITIQFTDGSVGSITYLANGDPQFPKEYIEVFCENRVAVMDNFSRLTTMANGKKKVKKALLQDKGHKSEMNALIECVRDGKSMPISFESIYSTTFACFKIRESIERKEMLEVRGC